MSLTLKKITFKRNGKYESIHDGSWDDAEPILLSLKNGLGRVEITIKTDELLQFTADGGFYVIQLSMFERNIYRVIKNPLLQDEETGITYSMLDGESELKYLTDHLEEAIEMARKFLLTGEYVDIAPNKWMAS